MGINRIRLLEMRERERDGKRENNGNHCMMASKRGYGKRDKNQKRERWGYREAVLKRDKNQIG